MRKIAIFLGDVLGELGDGSKSTKEKRRKSENKTLECTRRTFETSTNFGRSVKVLPVSRRDNTHGIYWGEKEGENYELWVWTHGASQLNLNIIGLFQETMTHILPFFRLYLSIFNVEKYLGAFVYEFHQQTCLLEYCWDRQLNPHNMLRHIWNINYLPRMSIKFFSIK